MTIPSDEINTQISPTDFEKLVRDYLYELGKELISFKVIHDTVIDRIDGNYQIDVLAEFEVLGATFKVLTECKKHKNKIKREVVQLLFDKLRATGAQKGMIFFTSGFQDGAILFAKEHGIALIRVIDEKYTYFAKGGDSNNYEQSWDGEQKYVGEFNDDNSITFLQKGYMDSLRDFIFKT